MTTTAKEQGSAHMTLNDAVTHIPILAVKSISYPRDIPPRMRLTFSPLQRTGTFSIDDDDVGSLLSRTSGFLLRACCPILVIGAIITKQHAVRTRSSSAGHVQPFQVPTHEQHPAYDAVNWHDDVPLVQLLGALVQLLGWRIRLCRDYPGGGGGGGGSSSGGGGGGGGTSAPS
eukprot:scaffold95141_cov29-Tisochrysis_lutea.AAC.1